MNSASLAFPVYLPLLVSGFALVVCAVAFFRLQREIHCLRNQPASDASIQSAVAELASEIRQVRSHLEEAEQRMSPLSDWTAAEPSSLNLNRRGQVLRLYRRGDSLAHIASALGLSTGEVALIVKVQEMIPPGRHEQNRATEL